jgi:hypothetical protein
MDENELQDKISFPLKHVYLSTIKTYVNPKSLTSLSAAGKYFQQMQVNS